MKKTPCDATKNQAGGTARLVDSCRGVLPRGRSQSRPHSRNE
jgi:hypothetical protein